MSAERCHCFDLYELDGFLCIVDHWSPRLPEILQFSSLVSLHSKKERCPPPPVLPERGGGGRGERMSSCITKSEIRTGTKHTKPTRTSIKTKGVSCSCGQLRKNFRVLKLNQIKAKCQASENKLTGPDKRCFVSLSDILNASFLKFGETIYCKTPSNTFVPICNFDKPISAIQWFFEYNDISLILLLNISMTIFLLVTVMLVLLVTHL